MGKIVLQSVNSKTYRGFCNEGKSKGGFLCLLTVMLMLRMSELNVFWHLEVFNNYESYTAFEYESYDILYTRYESYDTVHYLQFVMNRNV